MPTNEGSEVTVAQASHDSGGLVDERAAAAFLGYTARALQNWRLRGGGPRYVKVSEKSIRYQRRDLQAWIDARLCDNTAMGHPATWRGRVAALDARRRVPACGDEVLDLNRGLRQAARWCG